MELLLTIIGILPSLVVVAMPQPSLASRNLFVTGILDS